MGRDLAWSVNMLNPIASANWNYDAAAHLALRASFGEPPAELEKRINQGLDSTLEHLLRTPPPSLAPPDWAYPTRDEDLLSRIRNAETTAEDRTSAYVNERQRTSANVSERQRTSVRALSFVAVRCRSLLFTVVHCKEVGDFLPFDGGLPAVIKFLDHPVIGSFDRWIVLGKMVVQMLLCHKNEPGQTRILGQRHLQGPTNQPRYIKRCVHPPELIESVHVNSSSSPVRITPIKRSLFRNGLT